MIVDKFGDQRRSGLRCQQQSFDFHGDLVGELRIPLPGQRMHRQANHVGATPIVRFKQRPKPAYYPHDSGENPSMALL